MNCFLFAAEFVCGAKQIGIRVFSWNRVHKISNISFIKKTNSVAPSLYSSFFFLCFSFSYLQTSFYLLPSFTATVLWTSVPVAIPITPALSLLLKVLLQLFCFRLFQNVSFVFFSCFLIKQHPIPEIFTAHFFRNLFLVLPVCPLFWN